MPISCPDCAASMPDDAGFCPACGFTMSEPERAHGRVGVFPEIVAGALAYFTFIPAIIFLLIEPYNKNRFVRFHSWQSIGLCIISVVVTAIVVVLGILPRIGPLVVVLLSAIAGLGFLIVWIVLEVKALRGEMLKLPVLGDIAERQS